MYMATPYGPKMDSGFRRNYGVYCAGITESTALVTPIAAKFVTPATI